MKKIFSKLFYWNAPAQGALFGLTFAAIGSVLWFCIFHALYITGILAFPWWPMWKSAVAQSLIVWGLGQLLILLYSTFLLSRFYDRFCNREYASFPGKNGWCLGLVFLPVIGGVLGGTQGVIGALSVVLVWYLPLFLLPKTGVKFWFANALAWSFGLSAFALIFHFFQHSFSTFFISLLGDSSSALECIRLHINGAGWWIVFAVGLMGILSGYFLTAGLLAGVGNIKFRRMFGKGVIALWSLLALAYFAGLGAALWASGEAAERIAELEQRFGRPMTAQAQEELFYNGEEPDAEFWRETMKQLSTLEEKLFSEKYSIFTSLPDTLPDKLQQKWHKHWLKNSPGLAGVERRFETAPPLPVREFKTAELLGMPLPELRHYRLFCRLERWRLEFALQNKDMEEAKKILRRTSIINEAATRETSLIGSLVWIACETIRLDMLERVLESRLFSDSDLRRISRELAEIEAWVPAIHERTLYTEAGFSLDFFETLGRGKVSDDDVFPVQSFRWVAPQLWWQVAQDKAELAKHHNTPDLTHLKLSPEPRFLLCNLLLPALQKAGYRFYRLTARLRSMQVLIAAEEFRRAHGSFPETMENLPPDPFTGEPLKYRKGEATLDITNYYESPDDKMFYTENTTVTVPAIQVWSVG